MELLFVYLSIKTKPTLNLKLDQSEVDYLENKLLSEDFDKNYYLLLKISLLQNKEILESMNKLMNNISLCSFENKYCYEYILSLYDKSNYKSEELEKILSYDKSYSTSTFEKIALWYKSHINLMIKDQEERQNYSFTKIDENKEFKNNRRFIEDFNSSNNNTRQRKDETDYEDIIMKSFLDGTSENFGY